jgi:hypothetical protein
MCKLFKPRPKPKFFGLETTALTNMIVNLWNDLPDYVVTAGTTNSFKGRLDNFWGFKKFFITGKQNSTLEPEKTSHSFIKGDLSE